MNEGLLYSGPSYTHTVHFSIRLLLMAFRLSPVLYYELHRLHTHGYSCRTNSWLWLAGYKRLLIPSVSIPISSLPVSSAEKSGAARNEPS